MMRIAIFLFTNLSIIVVFGLVLSLIGIQSDNILELSVLALISGFAGSFISLFLSKWIALQSVNGELIEKPSNEKEHWLMNTVYQQSKQVGIITPQIAIYHTPDINAFATGMRKNSSLIAISTGLLRHMSREETEAVIAHEISHIKNGDMVTMTLIQGVVNTFVIFVSRTIARIVSSFLEENQDKEEKNSNYSFVYFSVSTLLELIFGILANIITLWFSRHREFYADAGSARLAGREKMISALHRMKTSYEPQEPDSILTFCINGRSKSLNELFMTHPPLDKRIEVLRSGKYLN